MDKSDLVAAGICVIAKDTGRCLMLQRAIEDGDPASGTWEFPGGHIETGETPFDAAAREWMEETGCVLPVGDEIATWVSGIYHGTVYVVASEELVPINMTPEQRTVLNPDDPDGDLIEVAAWWSPEQIRNNGALREELKTDLEHVLTLINQVPTDRIIAETKVTFMANTVSIFQSIGHEDGQLTHADFLESLKGFNDDEDLTVDIHSDGGDMMQGLAIHDSLKRRGGNVTTRNLGGAYSIASIDFMAGDRREMAENALLMIHNGRGEIKGTAEEIRQQTALLDILDNKMVGIYTNVTGLPEAKIKEMLAAETWLTADEAIELGFATHKIPSVQMAAKLDHSKYKNFPSASKTLPEIGDPFPTHSEPLSSTVGDTPSGNDRTTQKVGDPMTTTKVAASVQDLKTAFPKASNDFIVNCQMDELTVEAAGSRYFKAMEEDMEDKDKMIAELTAKITAMEEEHANAMNDMEKEYEAKFNAQRPGPRFTRDQLKPVAHAAGENADGDAAAMFRAEVDKVMSANTGMTRPQAVRKVRRANPGLHERFVAQVNTPSFS